VPTDVGPGEALCIPRGAVHRFDNTGDADANALAVVTPGILGPAYSREVAAILDAAAGGRPGYAALGEVMRRHGLTSPAQTEPAPERDSGQGPAPRCDEPVPDGLLLDAHPALVADELAVLGLLDDAPLHPRHAGLECVPRAPRRVGDVDGDGLGVVAAVADELLVAAGDRERSVQLDRRPVAAGPWCNIVAGCRRAV
jgi:hypothetical protein